VQLTNTIKFITKKTARVQGLALLEDGYK